MPSCLVRCCRRHPRALDARAPLATPCTPPPPRAAAPAGLKYLQKRIKLSFQRRLSLRLHGLYTAHRAYYAASTLGGLGHADQRITEDVERFSHFISELYRWGGCWGAGRGGGRRGLPV